MWRAGQPRDSCSGGRVRRRTSATSGRPCRSFDLPFLFADQDWANKIADGWLGDAASAEAAKTTQHKVFEVFSAGGFRMLGNTVRVIKSPVGHEGHQVPRDQEPDRVHPDQDLGRRCRFRTTGCSSTRACRPAWSTVSTCRTPWQYVFKHHEVNKFYTETGGAWGGNHPFRGPQAVQTRFRSRRKSG